MDARKDEQGEAWLALGEFIRAQRKLARLSLRQMADMARVSNPYLSQIERGLYRPSAQVIKSIADTLNISAETLYAQVGLVDRERVDRESGVEDAIRLDPGLGSEQKAALLQIYRTLLAGAGGNLPKPDHPVPAPRTRAPRRRRRAAPDG